MIRTSWRGKRLWNLSIVRVHVTIRPRILILRVDTHFSPRDLLVQVVKKHLRGERERERREQFFQHIWLFFDEKKRIATIKFNILILTTRKLIITDLSWIFNEYDNLIFGSLPIYIIFLSIILCVFNRNRTINTRKKKKKEEMRSYSVLGSQGGETLWNETKWWVSDSRDYLGGDGRGEQLEREPVRKREERVKLVRLLPGCHEKYIFLARPRSSWRNFSSTKEASSASLESLNRRIQFNNSFLFTYINAIDTVLQFSRVESRRLNAR